MPDPNFADKTIWTGDNLDILRGMNSECVDLIYLDPPYNSNQNYAAPVGSAAAGAAFKDTWTLSDLDVAWMGLIADEQPALAHVVKTAGLTHGKGMQSYLTMMAVRLMEMHRVLKLTGSIYLNCDPTASHYLKLLLDAIFGAGNFVNEIVWKRTHAHNDPNQFGRITDHIFFYRMGQDAPWNRPYTSYDEEYVRRFFRHKDERGTYRLVTLTGPGTSQGDSGGRWRGYSPTDSGRTWSVPRRLVELVLGPEGHSLSINERLDALEAHGYIYWPPKGKVPHFKQYLNQMPGTPVQNLWTDINKIVSASKERVGYPTQKPLALLERIILASSNEGDMVLDPFCGCATACVAAERLGRKWVGIDISPKAVELVNLRIQKETASIFKSGYVTARTDIPRRTDIDVPIPYRQNKHVLYGQQEGCCNGCKGHFEFRNFTIDHKVPQSRGGTDHIENLQLLCGACNSLKGDRPMEYLAARLAETR